jgi:plastocyanin
MAFTRQPLHRRIVGPPRRVAGGQPAPIGSRLLLAALTGLLVLALGACATDEASPATPADAGGSTVTIQDMAYSPDTLTVQAGTTVTWVWRDGAIAHDVKGDGFKSEVVSEGTFGHRFDRPGTYDYVCSLHPNMTGTIEVTG